MQAVILAGGLGTRLGDITRDTPKSMVRINGKPFLQHQLGLLLGSGIDDVVFCIGHLGDQINDYFRDGSAFGVRVRYSSDGDNLLGPIGALKKAEDLLQPKFFVIYGDAYPRLAYPTMWAKLSSQKEKALIAVYQNRGRYGKSDVTVRHNRVEAYDKEWTAAGMTWINFGVVAMKKGALSEVKKGAYCDEESFYARLIYFGQLRAYPVISRPYEIGTPSALQDFSAFVGRGYR